MTTLKEARQLKMLTQKELAEQVGVVIQSVQHWEAGTRRPRPAQQRKICAALDLTPQEMRQIMASFDAGLAKGEGEGGF